MTIVASSESFQKTLKLAVQWMVFENNKVLSSNELVLISGSM